MPMLWQTSRHLIDLGIPRVMGIVNVTPDSFSDGGRHATTMAARAHAERLVEEGADIRVIKSPTNLTKATQRPKFIDAANGNFRAALKSPVIDKGANAKANGAKDLDGRKRKSGKKTDIGATEFTPPQTTITGGPSGTVTDAPPPFTFKSSRPGSTFQCRSDAAVTWIVCASPFGISWSQGSHTFRVRAVDALGYIDPTPAKRIFTIDNP